MRRTKTQRVGDIIEMRHIKAIIQTYNGDADRLAEYVERCVDRLHNAEADRVSEKEFQAIARELDAAQSALAIVEEGDGE